MQTPRLLVAVVDDEEQIRKALKRLLRNTGFEVEVYASGQEFLDSVAEQRPDCVIPDCVVLDIRMPHMSGYDVQARLKAERVGVPVILITGLDEPSDREMAMSSGAFAFLRKPFTNEALLACIAQAVKPHSKPPERTP